MEPAITHPSTRCIILLHDFKRRLSERDDINDLHYMNWCCWLLCQCA